MSPANAFKYTGKGWVRVQRKAQDLPAESDGTKKSKVMLTVSDSGRGISLEFIKTKLFVPFSQENMYVSGTGLRMSIVRSPVSQVEIIWARLTRPAWTSSLPNQYLSRPLICSWNGGERRPQ